MPGGGKGKGGSISITGDANKPVTMDLAADLTTVVGGGDKPVRLEAKSDTTIGGGDRPLATDATLHLPDPVRTDSKMDLRSVSEMAITRPIETRSDMRLDVQPVVVDMCFTANIGKVPRLCIRRPYDHHLRLRVLGLELLSLDLTGQRSLVIDDLPKRSDVAWGAEHHRPDERTWQAPQHKHDWTGPTAGPRGRQPQYGGTGLRISLGS